MGEARTMGADWVPGVISGGILSGLGALYSWRVSSAKGEGKGEAESSKLESESAALRQDIRDLRQDLRDGAAELRSLNSMLLKLQASQDVVNVMNGKALESLARKQDELAAIVGDHSGTLGILTELVKKKGLIE